MGRFNVSLLRYLQKEDFRTLAAIEMGMKNHEYVPLQLCCSIAKMKGSGMGKKLGELVRHKLIAYEKSGKCEGYRLTNLGYDFLALNALRAKGVLVSVGNQIGVGKESDVYLGENEEGQEVVVKLHRLGRTSFRKVKEKRDYHGKRRSPNWLYLSRLAALKEYAFMEALHGQDPPFPVPHPLAVNRHCLVMSLVPGIPLARVSEVPDVPALHDALLALLLRLASVGLIHSDFNEFNILIMNDTAQPVLIDFPQMVSTSHANAKWYFDRDVRCVNEFFRKRFSFEAEDYPELEDVEVSGELDVEVSASGFVRAELGEEYASGDEEELRHDSSFSESSDEDEAPIAVPIHPVAQWLHTTQDPTADQILPLHTLDIAEPTTQEHDASSEGAEIQSVDDIRSVVTSSTIAPQEIRSRLRKQVSSQSKSAELKGALKKNVKVNTRRMRSDNKLTIAEYGGWMD